MDNVARYSGHVRQEGGSGQDDGIISNETTKAKEEHVKVQEQPVPNLSTFLEHLECQVPNQTGSVDGNGDVCQRDEEHHNVNGGNTVCPNGSIVDFFSADCQDSKKEQIRYQGGGDKVQGEVEPLPWFDFAILIIVVFMLRTWRYYSQTAQGIQEQVPRWPRDVYWYMKRK